MATSVKSHQRRTARLHWKATLKPYRTTYRYQDEAIVQVIKILNSGPGVLLEMCVGSGKTLVALVIANNLRLSGAS